MRVLHDAYVRVASWAWRCRENGAPEEQAAVDEPDAAGLRPSPPSTDRPCRKVMALGSAAQGDVSAGRKGVRHLRTIATIAALTAALTLAVTEPAGAHNTARAAQAPGTWCGGNLWKLMTLSDATRWLVYPTAQPTNIPTISSLTAPKRILADRTSTGFEQQVWQLTTVIERYRLQSNGEIALELFDIPSSMYMDAYMPNPRCLSPTQSLFRSQILAARRALTSACPPPTPAWQLLGARVKLAGVGFWNPAKTTLGALGNGAELRPVTNLAIKDGCGHFG
jgi:hypothetical protein